MAYDAPLQLLEYFAAAKTGAHMTDTNEPGDYAPGPNWLEAALSNAARLDGPRTMNLLPGIMRNLESFYLPSLLEAAMRGWVQTDPAGAIRWTTQHRVPELGNKLHTALQSLNRGGESLLAALPSAGKDEEFYFLLALSACYKDELSGDAPETVLNRVTPEQADQLLRHALWDSMGGKDWEQSLHIVSRASRSEQLGYMLPNLATRWLCDDPDAASRWITSLPDDDQRAIFEKAGSHYEFNDIGRAALERLERRSPQSP
jgi:hypothetical protein